MKDRAFDIATNRNYDGCERALASMVYKSFDKKTGTEIIVNEQLAEELCKPVIKFFLKKVSMRDLKTTFGQQISLKWNHCLQRIKI